MARVNAKLWYCATGTSIDQGIAYVLMLVALVLTYLIHAADFGFWVIETNRKEDFACNLNAYMWSRFSLLLFSFCICGLKLFWIGRMCNVMNLVLFGSVIISIDGNLKFFFCFETKFISLFANHSMQCPIRNHIHMYYQSEIWDIYSYRYKELWTNIFFYMENMGNQQSRAPERYLLLLHEKEGSGQHNMEWSQNRVEEIMITRLIFVFWGIIVVSRQETSGTLNVDHVWSSQFLTGNVNTVESCHEQIFAIFRCKIE